jgi:hypothetical protein
METGVACVLTSIEVNLIIKSEWVEFWKVIYCLGGEGNLV